MAKQLSHSNFQQILLCTLLWISAFSNYFFFCAVDDKDKVARCIFTVFNSEWLLLRRISSFVDFFLVSLSKASGWKTCLVEREYATITTEAGSKRFLRYLIVLGTEIIGERFQFSWKVISNSVCTTNSNIFFPLFLFVFQNIQTYCWTYMNEDILLYVYIKDAVRLTICTIGIMIFTTDGNSCRGMSVAV